MLQIVQFLSYVIETFSSIFIEHQIGKYVLGLIVLDLIVSLILIIIPRSRKSDSVK